MMMNTVFRGSEMLIVKQKTANNALTEPLTLVGPYCNIQHHGQLPCITLGIHCH